MSLTEYLYQWHAPEEVKKETAKTLSKESRAVYFSYSGADKADIEMAYRIAAILEQAYSGEMIEMRLHDNSAEIRFNEGAAVPVMLSPIDNSNLKDKCVLLWGDETVPTQIGESFCCWQGDDNGVRKIK